MQKHLRIIILLFLTAAACNFKLSGTNPTAPPIRLTNTYTNIADDYSFRYPDGYEIKSADDFGNEIAATNESPEIHVNRQDGSHYLYRVTEIPFDNLAIDKIPKNFFALDQNPEITSIQIDGVSAYKVGSKTSGQTADFYLLQKPGQKALEMVVVKNSDVAQQIFGTFRFAK